MTWHDTVAVPGMGVFCACIESAQGSVDGTVLSAPRRVFRFEAAEGRFGSGCLVESVARERECDIAEATRLVAAMASQFRQSVDSTGLVLIEGVGILRTSPFGKGYWLESAGNDWLTDISLESLSAVAGEDTRKEMTPAVARELTAPETGSATTKTKVFVPAVKYAASWIAAILGLAIVALLVDFINRPSASPVAAALGFASPAHEDMYPAPTQQTAPLMLVFNTPADGMSIVEPTPEEPLREEPASNVTEATPAEGPYYMIVASLASVREANDFIASHDGADYSLGILEKDGRIRVYAAAGTSFEETVAQGRRSGATSDFEQWWVCRR